MNKLLMGSDGGLGGAIGIVHADGALHSVDDMPAQARGSGRVTHEVDAGGLLHTIWPIVGDIALALVEKVGARPEQGVASMFSLGHSTGVIDDVVGAFGIQHAAIPVVT